MEERSYKLAEYLKVLFSTGALKDNWIGADLFMEVGKDLEALEKAAKKL